MKGDSGEINGLRVGGRSDIIERVAKDDTLS